MGLLPFAAFVGTEELKSALLCLSVDPSIGGFLLLGSKGTGKSTLVRALAELLPEVEYVAGCTYGCDPKEPEFLCDDCRRRGSSGENLESKSRRMRMVELPIGATDDRVVGSINIERTLKEGRAHFEPGLVANANRNILYVDEVNLLPDHIVDLILDAAAFGWNVVEREGISLRHPARFILIGTMNPEEGELRPQLLDRFAISIKLQTILDPVVRAEIVRRNIDSEKDSAKFLSRWSEEQERLKNTIWNARRILKHVEVPDSLISVISTVCSRLAVDGYRPDIVATKIARARAALDGRKEVSYYDLEWGLQVALAHRTRASGLKPPATLDEISKTFQEVKNLLLPPSATAQSQLQIPGTPQQASFVFNNKPKEASKNEKPVADEFAHGRGTRRRRLRLPSWLSVLFIGSALFLLALWSPLFAYLMLYLLFVAWLSNRLRKKQPRGAIDPSQTSQSEPGSKSRTASKLLLLIPRRGIGSPKRHGINRGRPLMEIVPEEHAHGPPLLLGKVLQRSRWLGRRKAPQGSGHAITTARQSRSLDVSFSATIRNAAKKGAPLKIRYEDIRTNLREGKAKASLVMVLDTSESMIDSLPRIDDSVKAVRRESRRKRDRVSLVVFKGEEAFVLQHPTTNFNLVLQKLQMIGLSDFTPLASGMIKGARLALAEKARGYVPVAVIVSEGATNVSIPRLARSFAELPDPFTDALHVAKVLQFSRTNTVVVNMHHAPFGQPAPMDLLMGTQLMKEIAKTSKGVYVGFDHYSGQPVTIDLSQPYVDADLLLKR